MSKSGVYAHFDSKQDLQLATVQEAERIFDAEVIGLVLAAPLGLARLVALCEAYFDHLLRLRSLVAASSPVPPSRWAPGRGRSKSASPPSRAASRRSSGSSWPPSSGASSRPTKTPRR